MKHGMIFFAALLAAALVIGPVFAADTTNVNATVSDNSGSNFVSPDVAVNSSGHAYVSFVNGQSVDVYTNASGSFATQTTGITTGVNARLTAIALVGKEDSPVVAVVASGSRGDSFVNVYLKDSSAVYRLQLTETPILANAAGAGSDSVSITAIDLAANDSLVLLAIAYTHDETSPFVGATDSPTVRVYMYRLDGGRLLPARTGDSLTIHSGSSAVDIQLELSLAEASSSSSDSRQAFYVLVNAVRDSFFANAPTPGDTGVFLYKAYADTNGLRAKSRTTLDTGAYAPFFDVAMAVERVGGSDTRDRITVLGVKNTTSSPVDTFIIWELGGDSDKTNGGAGEAGAPVLSDRYTDIDTGLAVAGTDNNPPGSIAFGRSGNSLALAYVSAGATAATNVLYKATTSFTRSVAGGSSGAGSNATVSWTVDTYGTNVGYTQNNFDVALYSDSTANAAEELAQIVVSGTLYVVGYNDVTNHVFYTTLLGSSESKKKDSGVCLLSRMFGTTSMAKAVFPGLKTFRDTLLGTDLGRKIVSAYYSF